MLCQYTGTYIEEQVLDYADTKFMRDFFDEEGILAPKEPETSVDDEFRLAETFSFEVHPFDESGDNLPPPMRLVSTKKDSRRTSRK